MRNILPDEVPAGLRNVHDDAGQELGRVEGLGRIARLPGAAGAPEFDS